LRGASSVACYLYVEYRILGVLSADTRATTQGI
jgi:hypothetical protein